MWTWWTCPRHRRSWPSKPSGPAGCCTAGAWTPRTRSTVSPGPLPGRGGAPATPGKAASEAGWWWCVGSPFWPPSRSWRWWPGSSAGTLLSRANGCGLTSASAGRSSAGYWPASGWCSTWPTTCSRGAFGIHADSYEDGLDQLARHGVISADLREGFPGQWRVPERPGPRVHAGRPGPGCRHGPEGTRPVSGLRRPGPRLAGEARPHLARLGPSAGGATVPGEGLACGRRVSMPEKNGGGWPPRTRRQTRGWFPAPVAPATRARARGGLCTSTAVLRQAEHVCVLKPRPRGQCGGASGRRAFRRRLPRLSVGCRYGSRRSDAVERCSPSSRASLRSRPASTGFAGCRGSGDCRETQRNQRAKAGHGLLWI